MDQKKKVIIEAEFKDNASKGIQGLSGSLSNATGTFSKLGGVALGVGKVVAGIGVATAAALGAVTVGSVNAGANLDRLQKVTYRLGENMGVATEKIDDMVKGLEETNTFGINAFTAVSGFLKSGLLPMVEGLEATDKATGKVNKGFNAFVMAAKDIGAAAGVSSGEAIQRLTQALVRQDVAMLESLGVQVSLEGEYRKMAKSLGKTTMQLTEQERSQALLNAVMREGAKLSGVYSDTYDNLLKNLGSLKDLTISVAGTVGKTLLPPFQAMTNAVLSLSKNFRDGLFSVLPNVDTAMQGLMTAVSELLPALGITSDSTKSFAENLGVLAGEFLVKAIEGLTSFVLWMKELKTKFDEFANSELVQSVVKFLEVLYGGMKEFVDGAGATFKEWWDDIAAVWKDTVVPAVDDLKESLTEMFSKAGLEGEDFDKTMKEIGKFVGGTLVASIMALAIAITILAKGLQLTVELGMWLTQVFRDMYKWVEKTNNAIGDTVMGLFGANTGKRQSGGLALQGGVYDVGEFGKERVILPKGSRVMNANETAKSDGVGGITINIQAPVYGVDNLQSMIIGAVNKATAQQNRLDYLNIG